VSSTIKAAALLAAGQTATSLQVAALAEGVLKSMFVTRLKIAGVALLTAALIGLGTTAVAYRAVASDPGAADAAVEALAKDPPKGAELAERPREPAVKPETPTGDPAPSASAFFRRA
jgi:hypothetical protein